MHQIEQPLESFSDYAKYIEQKHTRNGLTVSPESAMQEAVAEWCSENFLGRKQNTESSHPERTAEAIREFCKKEPAAAQKAAEILEEYQGLDSEIANLADGLKQNFAKKNESNINRHEKVKNYLKDEIIKGKTGFKRIGQKYNSWYNKDGSINYPPNNGAVIGTEKVVTIKVGESIGRYGCISDVSNYVTQTGTSSNLLSLSPTTDPSIYREFIVIKDIPKAIQAEIAPWGDSPGGGVQYELPMPIKQLIKEGYIAPKK